MLQLLLAVTGCRSSSQSLTYFAEQLHLRNCQLACNRVTVQGRMLPCHHITLQCR